MVKRSQAYLMVFAASLLLACGGDDTTKVSVKIYPAEGAMHDTLLTDGSSSFMELVLTGGPAPFVQRFDLANRSGQLLDLPVGVGYRLEARGFSIGGDGSSSLNFYGASNAFGVDPGVVNRITVQVGRADCLAYNRPSVYRDPTGTADMTELRVGMSATLLRDGRVLVAGGATLDTNGNVLTVSDTVEIFDPVHSQFLVAPFRLSEPRAFHTATLLSTGEVMIVGGLNGSDRSPTSTASTINVDGPNYVSPVTVGLEFQARYDHKAITLSDGSVLIVGGTGADGSALDSSYRYYPVDHSFRVQGRMKYARTGHSLSPMLRGTELALVAGGKSQGTVHGSVEVFTINPGQTGCQDGQVPNETDGCWVEMPQLTMNPGRWGHTAVAAYGGEDVVLIGGYTGADGSAATDEIRVVPQSLGGLFEAGNLLTPRGEVAAVESNDGVSNFILVAGGRRDAVPQQTAVRLVREEVNGAIRYNVESLTDGCIQPGSFPEARWSPVGVRLTNDVILMMGGGNQSIDGFSASRRAELYFPRHVRQ